MPQNEGNDPVRSIIRAHQHRRILFLWMRTNESGTEHDGQVRDRHLVDFTVQINGRMKRQKNRRVVNEINKVTNKEEELASESNKLRRRKEKYASRVVTLSKRMSRSKAR